MYKESESLRKLHKIREQMYEETKHMTAEEKIVYINSAADAVEKKYGFKLRKATHSQQ